MLLGLDGVEIGLIITFLCLFGAILSGFPVAFAIGGAGVIAFAIIAALDGAGLLIHQAVDAGSQEYRDLLREGVAPIDITKFRFPEIPLVETPVFPGGWELAVDRNVSFVVNRINERVLAGQSIETLLAVLMFVLMGITLERSRIAEDLLTTMARVFGPLPGGLAVSVVIVGAFLAASTGIVGATVVTMGLLSLPTMLRAGYSRELSTGVIAASGTLGQIIPPSIVIVLLGSLAGDIYAAAQETRAQAAGCRDAFTLLGEAAVVSVGTLFQAAIIPGVLLAVLYAAYAFGFALLNPRHAPPVTLEGSAAGEIVTRDEALTWFLGAPAAILAVLILMGQIGLVGSQSLVVSAFTQGTDQASLRTNVSPQCQEAMIAIHGQEAFEGAAAQQGSIDQSGGGERARRLTPEELQEAARVRLGEVAPIGTGVAIAFGLLALMMTTARGVAPSRDPTPLYVGLGAVALAFVIDWLLISPLTTPGTQFLLLGLPIVGGLWAATHAARMLGSNELLRVVFPPLVLIVAVLGSILGGITNPTPAAALGAGGAIMLAAYRRQTSLGRSGRIILMASFAIVIMLLAGINFDLRLVGDVRAEERIAYVVAQLCYYFAIFGILYACVVLLRSGVLGPVVRETAKVTSMVFTILIGSQVLNLVLISFGGEHYIQSFLRAFDSETTVFLIVMLVLFVLGFVLDFLEIIYIVVPIVGPVIYGGTLDPSWVTIMIAVNLQTSFLTPPFGFALFYLRGVAPPEVATGHIYRGIVPFVGIQVLGLALLWLFPDVVTILPNLLD